MTGKPAFLPARWTAAAAIAAGAFVATPAAQAQEKVLRAVMHADVRTLDPFWTTQTIAGIHGDAGLRHPVRQRRRSSSRSRRWSASTRSARTS